MKFYDKVKITVISAKGGDGVVSARRETGVPYGGPAGGNGGKGGSVILQANPNLNTLVDFQNMKKFKADLGQPGRTKEQYGKDAEDLIIGLPLGSIVRDAHTGKPIWHCYHTDDKYVICRGGQGGIGNMHFKNSINQYPQFALLGEPGETKDIEIELQLLADVALIGTPSVGKSSLINTVANVKAKVADYPFTTLIPNLGSVKHRDVSFNMIDVPGLIAGASQGKGLGNEFLRHIMKARVLCFMLDMSRYEAGIGEFAVLFDELITYLHKSLLETKDYGNIDDVRVSLTMHDAKLQMLIEAHIDSEWKNIITKDIVFVCNKSDVLQDPEVIDEYLDSAFTAIAEYCEKTCGFALDRDYFSNHAHVLSTYSQEGIQEFLNDLVENHGVGSIQEFLTHTEQAMEEIETNTRDRDSMEISETTEIDMPMLVEKQFVDEQDVKYAKVWTVREAEIARLVYMMPWGNDEAEMRFWNVLDKKKLLGKMITTGLVKGDIIHVKSFYTGVEDRFIRY